jgi:hypothetical protein
MSKVERFARKCDITNKGINEGYVIGDGDMYIGTKEDFLVHLKSLNYIDCNGVKQPQQDMSDDDLMQYYFNDDYYYWTEWESISDDFYFTADGVEVEIDGHDSEEEVSIEITKYFGGKEYVLVQHVDRKYHLASEKESVVKQLMEMGCKVRCIDDSGYPNKGLKYTIWIAKNNNN